MRKMSSRPVVTEKLIYEYRCRNCLAPAQIVGMRTRVVHVDHDVECPIRIQKMRYTGVLVY
jgi:hypothetical protein